MSVESEIKKILEQQIKPMLALHRGDVDFVSYVDGVVKVRLKGGCIGCPLSQLTLKAGIEETLKANINGIKRVENIE